MRRRNNPNELFCNRNSGVRISEGLLYHNSYKSILYDYLCTSNISRIKMEPKLQYGIEFSVSKIMNKRQINLKLFLYLL